MYIITSSWDYLIVNELTSESHLVVGTQLKQPMYFKDILTSKFGSKDMLL